jgi:beta-lactamase superfamily II metal-dependent hydrolase
VRTANGHQVLIDAGPDPDRFAQAIGRALPPTARTIDVWLLTSGRRTNIGAGSAVLKRFDVDEIVVAAPDAWSASLRAVVQQAQAAGVRVASASGPVVIDGVGLTLGGDGRSWLIEAGSSVMAIVPPETSWGSLPSDLDGAIFTNGGPPEWQGPGKSFSVIQVAANNRQGLPVRAVLHALEGGPLYRTDRVGTVELVAAASRFTPAE